MAAYLTVAQFKALTIVPPGRVEDVEALHPGWIDGQLAFYSSLIDSRLRKRYAAPFSAPTPPVVELWLVQLVTPRVYLKAGIDSTDEQFAAAQADVALIEQQLREAADSKDGLFDLPLRADTTATGISKGAPLGYTEISPYSWTTNQRDDGRAEDAS